jgi:hypothetical protein
VGLRLIIQRTPVQDHSKQITTQFASHMTIGEASKIIEAVKEAPGKFKLCRNRMWAVARSLPPWEQNLLQLISSVQNIPEQIEHAECSFDFCEVSRRDFTSVAQRHESRFCKDNSCHRHQGWFPEDKLKEALESGTPTAWKLNGKSMIEPPQQFMAISHVWSDGTGTGSWPRGEVNSCLYSFFRGIAKQFQCKGIWWDTICIPKEKAARSIAINRIQSNYENARITLVHDCYLREWEWTDKETAAETACFAIIMSPWFSRGWTALELAKSRKVKIVFKGPLIKDLDEILTEAPPGLARDGIVKLRNKSITNVDDLLATLGPRHTSWPRDLAIISGLLVGVKIHSNASQQGIYKSVLQKMKTVNHGHLFHNLPTMSGGFSWCPVSLLDLPLGLKGITPPITKYENVGMWKSV